MKSKVNIILMMFVLILAFWVNTDTPKANAFNESTVTLTNEPVNNLVNLNNLVTPKSELRQAWVVRTKFVAPIVYPIGPPAVIWHEEIMEGTQMAGYLSKGKPLPTGGHYYQYEGYLYNKKYPIPTQSRIIEGIIKKINEER